MHTFNDDKAAPPYSESDTGYVEQDNRPLPEGWIRQWDPNNQHYFFVDTRANPPRSIWDHPLDDVQYRKAHGLPDDSDSESTTSSSSSSSSDSESRDKKKKKISTKLKRPEGANHAGPSFAPHPPSPGGGRGLFGTLGQALFGPHPTAPVSPSQPGPSYAPMQPGMMYSPPSYPFTKRQLKQAKRAEKRAYRKEKREEKRAWREEKRVRKDERRMMKAQRKAMMRGYGFPGGPGVPGVPQPSQMPPIPQMRGLPPVPQVPPVPGSSREYQPAPGYSMPSEKHA